MHDEFAEPDPRQRPDGGEGCGGSDDDRQPDDVRSKGTLGDAGGRRPIPKRVSGSPRELLDLDPSRGKRVSKRPRPEPPEPPR